VILLPGETNSSAPDKHYFCNWAIYSKPATEAMPGRHPQAEAGERTRSKSRSASSPSLTSARAGSIN